MAGILDIARDAGVSHSVVSAVVNRRWNSRIFVSEITKERILKLLEEHGYVPRKAALNFPSGKTNAGGIIVNRLTPHFSALLEAVGKHAVKAGQEIMHRASYWILSRGSR
jgi:LacI family transcriptional regulator